MRFFVDTSGWIALVDRQDAHYADLAAEGRTLQDQRVRLITSDYVLDEALTHLRARLSHKVATDFGRLALSSTNVEIVRVDEEVWAAAWEIFQAYSDKHWSFTDCTSFAIMRQRNLAQALAFDRHFIQAGFQLWPG
jgi:predicted nucleic acid-binding protein